MQKVKDENRALRAEVTAAREELRKLTFRNSTLQDELQGRRSSVAGSAKKAAPTSSSRFRDAMMSPR